MNPRLWWLGGGALIAVGAALVLLLRPATPELPARTRIDAPLTADTAAVAPAPTATVKTDEPAPPWLRGDAAAPAAAPAAGAPAEDPEHARQMAALQQSVQGLVGVARQRSVASETYLRQALATLEQMNDPAITSQVNLGAVRQNLEISIRMQQLTGQMQQVLAQPPGEQRQQRQDALMAQLRQLQGQLRSDVRASPAATVP